MASMNNAFGLLNGAADAKDAEWSTAGKKKRGKKASPALQPASDAVPVVPATQASQEQLTSPESQAAQQNGHIVNDDDGFVRAGRHSRSRSGQVKAQAPPAAVTVQLMPQADALAHLEQTASTLQGNDRLRLWQEWARQLDEAQAGDGVFYAGANGKPVSFEQVLRDSKALELSIQGCLTGKLPNGAESALSQLLSSFSAPALDPSRSRTLTQAVFQWRTLLQGDSAAEVASAAQQALAAVVSAVKAGPTAAGSDGRAQSSAAELEQAVAQQQKMLEQAATPKDAATAAQRLLQLVQQRLTGLTGGGSAHQSVSPAEAAAVDSLIAFAEQRCRASQMILANGQSRGSQQSAALTAFQADDTALKQQEAELEVQAAQLQAQLDSVRRQIATIADRRSAIRSQYAAFQAGGKRGAVAPLPDVALHERQLAAARQLQSLLAGSSAADASQQAAEADVEGALAAYLTAVQGSLQANVDYLAEVAERVRAGAERLQRVKKQAADLVRLGLGEKESAANQRQQASLQRTLKEAATTAGDVNAACQGAAEGVPRYAALMEKLPSDSAAAAVASIKDLASRAALLYEAVTGALIEAPAPRRRRPEEIAALLKEGSAEGDANSEPSAAAPAAAGDALSALSARLAAVNGSRSGGEMSLPQRAPRANGRAARTSSGGRQPRANGAAAKKDAAASSAAVSGAAAAAAPASDGAKQLQPQESSDTGVSPADKVIPEPRRVASGAAPVVSKEISHGATANDDVKAGAPGLGAWGRRLNV